MRSPALVLLVAVLVKAGPAAAQLEDRAAPPVDCGQLTNGGVVTPPEAGGDAFVPAQNGNIQLLAPPPNAAGVPRNVEIRLGGSVDQLDLDPPAFTVALLDPDSQPVPVTRVGGLMHPIHPLDAQTAYTVSIAPTDANPCPDCSPAQLIGFSTGDDIDTTPPDLSKPLPIDVFVMPDPALAQQCGLFFSQTHQIVIQFGGRFPINALIDVFARTAGTSPVFIAEQLNTGQIFPLSTSLDPTLPTALGDTFEIAVIARDLAGNTSAPRIEHIRARSFVDESEDPTTLPPLWCSVSSAPTVTAPAQMPENGRIEVAFPFEEVPVDLVDDAGNETPLIPVDDIAGGHVYDALEPLPPHRTFHVEALSCPHCVCSGCAPAAGTILGDAITTTSSTDTNAPAAPKFRRFGEDSDPALIVAQQCGDDHAALLVFLAPGSDDVTSALDLRYDASIRIADGPPLALAHGLVPRTAADGSTQLRIDEGALGRVLGEHFVLSLDAVDAAGNRSTSDIENGRDAAAGCSSTRGSSASLAILALLLLSLRRRRAR
ncbi:MAG TPA: hypothetical protein VGO62_16360 [Myxococcota bacterium]